VLARCGPWSRPARGGTVPRFEARSSSPRPSLVYCGDDARGKKWPTTLIPDVGFRSRWMQGPCGSPATRSRSAPHRRSLPTEVAPAPSSRTDSYGSATGLSCPPFSSRGFCEWRSNQAAHRPPQRAGRDFHRQCTRDSLFSSPAPALGASSRSRPCARTAWHTHPLGQTLIVTAGCGPGPKLGGPVKKIARATSSGARRVKTWHGATPNNGNDATKMP